jgi:hypothetical protein
MQKMKKKSANAKNEEKSALLTPFLSNCTRVYFCTFGLKCHSAMPHKM